MPTPIDPTVWMDEDYYEELSRRRQIRDGRPLSPLADVLPFIATPPQTLWTRR